MVKERILMSASFWLTIILFMGFLALSFNTNWQAFIFGSSYPPKKMVKGYVVNAIEARSTLTENPIMHYYFSFELDGKVQYGECFGPWSNSTGDSVSIQYLDGNPQYSTILGMSSGHIPLWATMIVLGFAIASAFYTRLEWFSFKSELQWISEECRTGVALKDKIILLKRGESKEDNEYQILYRYQDEEGNDYSYQDTLDYEEMMGYRMEELIIYEEEDPNISELALVYPKSLRKILYERHQQQLS